MDAAGSSWHDNYNRQIVLDGRAALERTSASLARSTQVAIETETIGTEVLSELDAQRESLLRSSARLEGTHAELTRAGRVIRNMRRNILYNKLTLIAIIVLEIFILSGSIYTRFIRH